jgi:fibronectin-binding autotransporter adhesin
MRLLHLVIVSTLVVASASHAATIHNYYGTSGALSGSVWSTNVAGPYTDPFAVDPTDGGVMNFQNAGTQAAGDNGLANVAGINATASFSITGSPTGTISNLNDGVIPINVDSGVTLNFGTQAFTTSATAGYSFTGPGTLALAGGAYQGGFTLNSGTIVANGVNAMGGGAANTLTINGGTIAANATRDFTNKFGGGITVGGNFTVGSSVAPATTASNLTFNNAMGLGGVTRKITAGGTGLYTFGGLVSNGGLEFAAAAPATTTVGASPFAYGVLLNNGSSTYAGGTIITSGTVRVGASSTPTSGVVTSGPLGTGPVTIKTGGKLSVSGVTNAAFTIGNAIVIDGAAILESPSTGRTLTLAGPLTSTNATDSIAVGAVNSSVFFTGDISGYQGSFLIDSTASNNLFFSSPGVAGVCLTDGSNAKFVLSDGGMIDATNPGSVAATNFLRFGDNVVTNTVATLKMGELSGTNGEINAQTQHATINIEAGYLNTDATFAGVWTGRATQTANFTKVGTGSLTLSGISSYGGPGSLAGGGITTVSNGTLIAGGDVSSTNVNAVVLTATAATDFLTFNNHGLADGDSFMVAAAAGGLAARTRYFVVNSTTNDFQVSTTPGGSVHDITADASPTGFAPGPFGSANTAIVMGNGATGSSNVSLLTGGAFKMARPINVTASGSGGATIGSEFDGNSTFSGAITLAKNVNLTSAATGGNTVNFSGVISGSGFGVTKVGAGKVTLSGANTYSGATKVQQGTLSISLPNSLHDSGDVYITTASAILDLAFAGTDTIHSLLFDGTPQATGTWGAIGSAAINQRSWFTGSGILSVTSAGGVTGDYNADGKVDAADYVVWRKNPGAFGGTPGGYNTWRQNFGNPPGSGSSLGGPAAVPEPAAMGLILSIVLGAFGGRRGRFNRAA